MGDGVGLADVGEELVAQAFTLGGAFHQAGDVDELHGGRQHALGLDDLGQGLEARIGHRHDAAVRLDGAEREVLRGDAGFGQGVEQGGLADVGQADDAAVESHGVSLARNGGEELRGGFLAVQLVHGLAPIPGEDFRQYAESEVDAGIQ
ncbi:hypothetical protein D3C84_507330 [compost metagenome]